jgi:hypothetical protein
VPQLLDLSRLAPTPFRLGLLRRIFAPAGPAPGAPPAGAGAGAEFGDDPLAWAWADPPFPGAAPGGGALAAALALPPAPAGQRRLAVRRCLGLIRTLVSLRARPGPIRFGPSRPGPAGGGGRGGALCAVQGRERVCPGG